MPKPNDPEDVRETYDPEDVRETGDAAQASVNSVATGDGQEPWLGQIDRYVLREKLGQGGFGAVYRAYDEVGDIDVAVKALPPLVAHNPEELENVRENFKLVEGLNHPNIAATKLLHPVVKVSKNCELPLDQGDYLVVMEYVRGTTLSRYLRQYEESKMPLDEALDICGAIAEALDFAHSRKIIHRDIKPANVMLTGDKQVKVLDFGLAAEIRSSMTRISKEVIDTSGTRPYMAPEQWTGSRQDAATDQYAMAVLLHELVSGGVPFQSAFDTGDAVIMRGAVLNETPAPLAELDHKQNEAVLRALSKEPAERFPRCADFVGACEGKKVRRARRVAATARGARPRSRMALAAIFILIVTSAVLGAVAVQWQSARRARDGVEGAREEAVLAKAPTDAQASWVAAEALRTQAQAAFDKKTFIEARKVFAQAASAFVKAADKARVAQHAEETRVAQQDEEMRRQIESFLKQARAAKNQKDFGAASEAVAQLLALDPEHVAGQALQDEIKAAAGRKEVVPVKSKAEVEVEDLAKINVADRFDGLLKAVRTRCKAANTDFDDGLYGDALEAYQWVLTECARLTELDAARRAAGTARGRAEQARQEAEQAKAPADAKALWGGCETLWTKAQSACDKMAFGDGRKLFAQSSAEFAKAKEYATGVQSARAAKEAYEGELAKQDQRLLTEFGGDVWTRVKQAVALAQRLKGETEFAAAVKSWEQGSDLLPAAGSEALENQRRAQYEEHLQTAVAAYKAERYDAAVTAYQGALGVVGHETDAKARSGLKAAQRESALATARTEKERGDWDAVETAAKQARDLDPKSVEAARLLDEAQPRLTITAEIDGREVPRATVKVGGVEQGKTPLTLKLEKGKTYEIEVSIAPREGRVYKAQALRHTVDRMGPRSLRAKLEVDRLASLGVVPVAEAKLVPLDGLAAGSREAQAQQQESAKKLGLPLEVRLGKTGIVLRFVPPGTFTMGSPENETLRDNETQHRVTLTQAIYLGKYEVTQGQWQAVMGANPSKFKDSGKDAPVEMVSWNDCQEFLKKLCVLEGVPAGTFRLPTEAEWEYACRAGTQTAFAYGDALSSRRANFDGTWPHGDAAKGPDLDKTVAVGSYKPNAWGMYDMHGNVEEWCLDWYEDDYPAGTVTGPVGPPVGRKGIFSARVLRGGQWFSGPGSGRSASRGFSWPSNVNGIYGLRVAFAPTVVPK